jgi:hypothetical protein
MKNWNQLSRLPTSEAYWQELTARIQQSTRAVSVQPESLWSRRQVAAAWTGVLMAAAAVVVLLMTAQASDRAVLRSVVAPADAVAAQLLNSRKPVSVVQLLAAYDPETRP